ncbi:hypothetical protein GGR54DRAFT_647153 [Hypoxylon sp. NC1633]|nr:hypothetical protein GGR54DRAFT_647153 [Hypoxylon sp. NC1633]
MRFSILIAGLFAVAARAQSETSSSTVAVSTTTEAVTTTTSNIDPSQSSAQAAMIACLNACSPDDVNCKAKCIAVPSPDAQNANQTVNCAAECPQGNGTASDNLNYANCVSACIAQYYYTTSGTPNLQTSSGVTSGASTPTVTQIESTVTSDGSTFVTSFSSTVTPSGTNSAASAASTSSSSAAADMLFSPVGSGIGLFSFLAAFLAL